MAEPVRIDGLGDLLKNLKSLHEDLQEKAARSAVSAAASLVSREAKKTARAQGLEKTGALIANISTKRIKTRSGLVRYDVKVRNGSSAKNAKKTVQYKGTRKIVRYENDPYYWWWHEFGTSKMPARPFMRPAFEDNAEKAQELMSVRLRKSIERFKTKYGS